jgi:hypothetical protein
MCVRSSNVAGHVSDMSDLHQYTNVYLLAYLQLIILLLSHSSADRCKFIILFMVVRNVFLDDVPL